LSVDALHEWPVHVFLNRYDPAAALHKANKEWLVVHYAMEVSTDVEQLVRAFS
jgi:hypothetical protein